MIVAQPHLLPNEGARCWKRSQRRIRAIGPRRHCELAAYHVISGRMRYLIDGRICEAGPRTLLWVDNNHAHMLLSETPDFDMWAFVFADAFRPRGEAPPGLVSRLSPDQHDDLCRIAEGISQMPDKPASLRGMAWWGERARYAAIASENSEMSHFHPIARKVAEALAHEPDLALIDLAKRLELTAGHVARLFRAETGERVGEYRNRCRLATVDRLMAQSRRNNLLSCALEAGFGSYPQFFRVFRTLRGSSPRQWYGALNRNHQGL